MPLKYSPVGALVLLVCLCIPCVAAALSNVEKEWPDSFDKVLQQHTTNPTIKAAIPRTFPPFYFTDSNNLPYGMAIEVLNEIDHHAGYQTEFIIKENWKDVFASIDNNEVEIIPNLGITEQRKKKYLFTRPYAKTEINVFIREHSTHFKRSDIKSVKTGVVEKNVGVKLARQNHFKDISTYPTIETALHALINQEIDTLIYPKVIAIRAARELKVFHLIEDTGITLQTIDRAIAVNRNYPEIHQRLDNSLGEYLQSQNYKDTYSAWYGMDPDNIMTNHLIIIDLVIFLVCLSYFIFLCRKKKLLPFKKDGNRQMDIIWLITLISIFIITTLTVTAITLTVLYRTSYDEQRQRLIDITKSRTRLIEAIARFDLQNTHKKAAPDIDAAYQNTIEQIRAAHKKFRGFGKTGEFTMAKINHEKKEIQFILRQRHSTQTTPLSLPFNQHLAVPMKMALLGHSGTIEAIDYRGEYVLAAYEPIKIFNLGIVAKIDIKEIRKPFIDAALMVIGIVIFIATLGAVLFIKILMPLINRLNYSEQCFYQLFKNTQTPVLLVSPKTTQIIDANNAASDFYGYTSRELLSKKLQALYPDNSAEMHNHLEQTLVQNQVFHSRHQLSSGELRDVEITANAVELDDDVIISFVISDITEKLKQAKQQEKHQKNLEQARKMEALGQLTGGIAHDFNNMLGVIMGYTSLSIDKIKSGSIEKIDEYLEQVLLASERAKSLIGSMMIFSRTDETQNHAIRLAPLLKENIKMMRSIIPSSISIEFHIEDSLPATLIEPVKLQQLFMNLCVNARDAMEGQGQLTIELKWYADRGDSCRLCFEKVHGEWIELSIQDTGTGMTRETLEHIFEPFYTTKVQGKGTGMGMPVVHGIVSEVGGHVLVDSAPGAGTKISILFKPEADDEIADKEDTELTEDLKLEKNIIIIDDESSIAELYKSILKDRGYHCKSFSSAVFALEHFRENPNLYDLIISDQTMPEVTGFQLVNEARKIRPDIPAIISTGFNENFNESIARKNKIIFLAKPVSKELLRNTVYHIFK